MPEDITGKDVGLAAVAAVAVGGASYLLAKALDPRTKNLPMEVAKTSGKLITIKPIMLPISKELSKDLSETQKISLVAKAVTSSKIGKYYPAEPLQLKDKLNLDSMRYKGILGRLVAQYYAFEHARIFYMTRCGALNFCDDTPTWLQRNEQLISEKDVLKNLKSSKWYGIGLSNKNYLDRWDDGTGSSKLWRRRFSLEATFSNWSGPSFANANYYVNRNTGYWHIFSGEYCYTPTIKGSPRPDYPFPDTRKRYIPYYFNGELVKCKSGANYISDKCINGKVFKPQNDVWDKFYTGDFDFSSAMAGAYWNKITHGYRYYDKESKGQYEFACPKNYYYYNSIPWRNLKGVNKQDRLKATYKLKPEYDSKKYWARRDAISRYYDFGYKLVRTVLDIMCARGQAAEDYPEFAEHCSWWMIPQPTKKMVVRYPDLSQIGAGVQGLADITTRELIDFVMSITPKPGTIVPWKDKGPLYTWPVSTGYMQPLSIPLPFKPRESDDIWGTIVQYLLSFETSICANVASGVVNTAIDAAVSWAEDVMGEWLITGIDSILDKLDNTFVSTAINQVKGVLKDVSGFAANMSRFVEAENLIGQLNLPSNLSKVLTNYLDLVSDDAASNLINNAKLDALALTDSLRKQWDWADDLLGSAGSIGNQVKKAIGQNR